MLEKSLSGNEIDFNDLEKEIFDLGCEFARNVMAAVLMVMDKNIAESRDKKKFRHKGLPGTSLKTLMGDVSYKRAVYETTLEGGEKACVYLLDEALKLSTFGKVTTNLATRIAEAGSVSSYREAAKNVSSMTGQTISHGGVWNVIQNLGEKLAEAEEINARLAKANEGRGEKKTEILFEEADGIWINMQGKGRSKKGRKSEMKMAVAYDGWELQSKGRYALRNKVMIAGFDEPKKFQKKKEGAIAAVFDTDEINIRILNGDGGSWIKGGITDTDVHFQLDPFHKNREITRKVKDEGQREVIRRLLSEKRIADLLLYIKSISELSEDGNEKKKLSELHEYFSSNRDGLIPYQERGLKLPKPPEGLEYRNLGTMEHHVCDGAAKRMKHQKASWSKKGAGNLGRILCIKVCGTIYEKVSSLSRVALPERFSEKIEEVLSAAKAPMKDGKGYCYPVNGGIPFTDTFATNGRKAIIRMLGDRILA